MTEKMESNQNLEQKIEALEKRIAELERKEAEHKAEKGLNFLKGKIVAAFKKNGKDVDIYSEEVHLAAIQMRDNLVKKGDEARKRLQESDWFKSV